MIITRYRLSFRLLELSQNTLIRTSDFLDNPSLGAIDATCQVFHPVGVTQKLCMQRAERALDPELWPKRKVMCWPEWADEVQYRARMRALRGWLDAEWAAVGDVAWRTSVAGHHRCWAHRRPLRAEEAGRGKGGCWMRSTTTRTLS